MTPTFAQQLALLNWCRATLPAKRKGVPPGTKGATAILAMVPVSEPLTWPELRKLTGLSDASLHDGLKLLGKRIARRQGKRPRTTKYVLLPTNYDETICNP